MDRNIDCPKFSDILNLYNFHPFKKIQNKIINYGRHHIMWFFFHILYQFEIYWVITYISISFCVCVCSLYVFSVAWWSFVPPITPHISLNEFHYVSPVIPKFTVQPKFLSQQQAFSTASQMLDYRPAAHVLVTFSFFSTAWVLCVFGLTILVVVV